LEEISDNCLIGIATITIKASRSITDCYFDYKQKP